MSTEMQWPVRLVRQTFVDYFVKKQNHTFVPSAPTVPRRDPTLLFTNAGMNQFKDLFLGTADPGTEFGKMKRAANSQTCIRAGGKHNDLEDVGRDTYHHTFFEMLGNWSFADYFKKEAIEMAWELLIDIYKLPKDRLYATYFEGNEAQNIPPDYEARDMWYKYLPKERVLAFGKDNFWEMGDTGPCGPCTEIHFDHIGGRDAAHLVNRDDPTVIEIWNLVFMQYNRDAKGLHKLPSGHVDTGAGLERLTAVLQGKKSNYDTDAWLPIFAAIQQITGFRHSYEYDGPDRSEDAVVAYRVVADHIRCCVVALSDGAMPDRVGRGFVLRRIIRRAVRFGKQFLGAKVGFLSQLVDPIVASLGEFFTHIKDPRTVCRVKGIILDEEQGFERTWKVGEEHYKKAHDVARAEKCISGKDAFILHDRYGFPLDLTQLMAEKDGFKVDVEEFWREMKTNQTSGGRMAAAKTFVGALEIDLLQKEKVPTTVDKAKYIWEPSRSSIVRVFDKSASKFVTEVAAKPQSGEESEDVGILLPETSFYAEAGGQTYDTGSITTKDGIFYVSKVFSYAGYVFHIGRVAEGSIRCGEDAELSVNYERRLPVAVNHTCTHLLNHALRDVLQYENPQGHFEVNQKGSFVSDEYFRFDFSWNAKLTRDEVRRTEQKMEAAIGQNLEVYDAQVPLVKAQGIYSIRSMFDEKYPDIVTVVSIGIPMAKVLSDPGSEELKRYSLELCGGTHIKTVGEIERAVIVAEDALMKGVRRMVVFTGKEAADAMREADVFDGRLAALKSGPDVDLDDKVKKLSILSKNVNDSAVPLMRKFALRDAIEAEINATNQMKKQVAAKLKAQAAEIGTALLSKLLPSDRFCITSVTEVGADRDGLQTITESVMKGRADVGCFIIGVDARKDKGLAMATLPAEMVKKGLDAVAWVRKACFGKGGGKPNAAQGGLLPAQVDQALAAAKSETAEMEKKLA